MGSAKVVPIQSDRHFNFAEYTTAEYEADLQRLEDAEREDWLKRTMREDKAEPWQFKACLVAAILLLYVWLMPWIEKVLR